MLDMDIVNSALVRQRTPDEVAAARAQAEAKKTELNQDDFLTLMLTQLKHQDPFKPMDPSQQVGQLAQFSSVSGLQSINKAISNLTESMRGNQVLDGASMIGRTVVAESNTVYLSAANGADRLGAQGAIDVPAGTASLTMLVRDSSGALVRTQALNPTAGVRGFTWDGNDDRGGAVSAGEYEIEIVAGVGGENVSLPTSFAALVTSVALNPATGAIVLDTDALGELPMGRVQRVL